MICPKAKEFKCIDSACPHRKPHEEILTCGIGGCSLTTEKFTCEPNKPEKREKDINKLMEQLREGK